MSSQRQNGRSPDSLPIGDQELRRLVHHCTDRLVDVEERLNDPRLHRLTGANISGSIRAVDLAAILLNGLYKLHIKPVAALLQMIDLAVDPDSEGCEPAKEMLRDCLLRPLPAAAAEAAGLGKLGGNREEDP